MENDEGEVVELLATLPKEELLEFQLAITRIVENGGVREAIFHTILEKYSDRDLSIAYPAFCILSIHYRRHRKIVELGLLIDRHRAKFGGMKSYHLFESLYYLARGSSESMAAALRSIRIAMANLKEHNGAKAAYADIVATSVDKGVGLLDGELELATKVIMQAIQSSPAYAKYPFLLAKLQCLSGDLIGAEVSVRQAVDLEDSTRATYALRVAEYQKLEFEILLRRSTSKLSVEIEKMNSSIKNTKSEIEEAVRDAKSQVLAQLGFFSGLLAIILTTVDVTKAQPATTAMAILLTMSGVIILSWTALSVFLMNIRTKWEHVLVSSLAVGLISAGMFIFVKLDKTLSEILK